METNKARPEYWTDAIERDILEPDKITIHLSHLRQTLIRRAPDPRLTALEAQVRELREVLGTGPHLAMSFEEDARYSWPDWWDKVQDKLTSLAQPQGKEGKPMNAEGWSTWIDGLEKIGTVGLGPMREMLVDLRAAERRAEALEEALSQLMDEVADMPADPSECYDSWSKCEAALAPQEQEVKPHPCGHM